MSTERGVYSVSGTPAASVPPTSEAANVMKNIFGAELI
jgi:hypothetical protein